MKYVLKLNKTVLSIIFVLFLLALCSCKSTNEYYYEEFKRFTSIKYLDNAELVYFDQSIGGIDSSGLYYVVYKFDEYPYEFVDQFYDHKEPKNSTCGYGPNEDFENKVNNLINISFKNKYDLIDEKYKIDWEKKYFYDYNNYLVIFFVDSNIAIILYLQD